MTLTQWYHREQQCSMCEDNGVTLQMVKHKFYKNLTFMKPPDKHIIMFFNFVDARIPGYHE